ARVCGGRRDLPLDLADQQAVLRLQGDRRGQAELAREVHRLGELPAGEVGEAVVAALALPAEAAQRAQGLVERGDRVPGVRLVEVDAVQAEPGQRRVERAGQ